MFDGEERPGAAHSALDFVGNHHDAVLIAQFADRLRKRGGTGMKPASP